MNEQRENDQTWREILYWGVALVNLVGLKQLWTAKLRPWIESTWGEIEAGGVGHPLVGTLDEADFIGLGLLVGGLVVGAGILLYRCRRWGCRVHLR